MTTQEQRAEWRELAEQRLSWFGTEGKAHDAIMALLADVDALTQERDALAASWQQEHTERVRLEERLKAAEQRAEALRAQLGGYLDGDEGAIAERNAALVELAKVRALLADAENYAAMQYENGRRYEPRRFETYDEWRAIYRKQQQAHTPTPGTR